MVAPCLVVTPACCVESLKVVTDVNPTTGVKLGTEVKFTAPGQCEVQHQIKRAVRVFSTAVEDCRGQPHPARCRERARTAYRPHIDELLEINEALYLGRAPRAELVAQAGKVTDACVADLSCHHLSP
jgi:hypothetical protein